MKPHQGEQLALVLRQAFDLYEVLLRAITEINISLPSFELASMSFINQKE